jgi:iron complex outermembrane recepter protein
MLSAITRTTLIVLIGFLFFAAHARADVQKIEIPPGELTTALALLARQSSAEIVYLDRDVRGIRTKGVSGTLSVKEAVTKLLEGTPLIVRTDSSGALLIAPPRSEPEAEAQSPKTLELEEVVVTGSHIRGGNVTSPVVTVDRKQIDRSGRATVQQVLQLLPQNFGGEASENAGGASLAAPSGSFTYGTGVNLRGLGNEATLVLLNGRRLAPTGVGEFVDISGIPLSAVDRIDVLTDGASAIYGSDAVAGVVNIVLREDYEGAETTARYGTVTSGGSDEVQLGQTFGSTWKTGHVLATYEYYEREKLAASDRTYTERAPSPLYLLPDQTRHSAILAFSQDLSSRIELTGTGNFSQRSYESMSNSGGSLPQFDEGEAHQFGGSLGLNVDIGGSWRATVDGATSVARASNHSYAIPSTTAFANGLTEFTVSSLDLKVDGPTVKLPGGYVRIAAGGSVREEKYKDNPRRVGSTLFNDDRSVRSVYAEALVPLVGDDNQLAAVRRLQLSIAGRYEDYSDFGSKTTPKLGLAWDINEAFRLRGSYGKSFRAPAFEQLRGGGPGSIVGVFLPDDPPAFAAPVIFYQGGNTDLKAETAETWTAGTDYARGGAAIHLSFFNIDYRNRIEYPPGGLFNALLNEELLGQYLLRNPEPALVQSIAADPVFLDFLGVPLSSVQAIVDFRLHNSATSKLRGADLDMTYDVSLGAGQLGLQANVQYLFDSKQQAVASAPTVDIVDTVFNPPELRARAGLTWSLQRVSASAILNYTGAYRDTRPVSPVRVGSWTTVDATLRYDLTGFSQGRALPDMTVGLSLTNLFDKDPPFVLDPANNVNFDGANANALGRFMALQVVSRW